MGRTGWKRLFLLEVRSEQRLRAKGLRETVKGMSEEKYSWKIE